MMEHVNRCIIISTKRGKIKGKERKGKEKRGKINDTYLDKDKDIMTNLRG